MSMLTDDVKATIKCALENELRALESRTMVRGLPQYFEEADAVRTALAALDEQPQMAHGDLREALAEYAHKAWSGWMKYLFEKGGTLERVGTYEDGKDAYVFTITMYSVERWMRQMCTPYAELSEQEKESDRRKADRILAIVGRTAPPIAESEPRIIVDEPDRFGIIRIWPFGREPYLASVDVHPHDPFANEQRQGYSIFFRGQLSTIEDTRRYAQALLKACEVAEGLNRQRQEADAQKGESNE